MRGGSLSHNLCFSDLWRWLCPRRSASGTCRGGAQVTPRRSPSGASGSTCTANGHDDGSLGEVFIQWGKQGSTGAGLMDIYAVALSVGLQHRVPLVELITPGLDLYCVPNGRTDDPQIPRVRSVIDYVARRLAIDWLSYPDRASLGVFTIAERVAAARTWMDTEDRRMSGPRGDAGMDAFRWEIATGISVPAIS